MTWTEKLGFVGFTLKTKALRFFVVKEWLSWLIIMFNMKGTFATLSYVA